ncbi:MAG: hypothetical protein JST32_14905 [Bacteroidetes bacterium]|nr:hypothetical protein [Bacteroidota bacterium]
MDVRIDIDQKFERDIRKLTPSDNKVVENKINHLIGLIRADQKLSNHLSKIHKYKIGEDFDGSLFSFRVNKGLRILLTSEEDPIFNEHILTLLRIVKVDELEKTFKSLAESFNQSFIFKKGLNG